MQTQGVAIQRKLLISQIINSIYLLLFCLMAFGTWRVYQDCESTIQTMLGNVGNANGESFAAGYVVMGNLAGAGTLSFFSAMLYIGLMISVAYALVFLMENICGYFVYAGFRRNEENKKIRNGIKADTVIKCILAVAVILPACFLLFTEQWLFGLIMILPQIVVAILSVWVIRLLREQKKGMWTEEMG